MGALYVTSFEGAAGKTLIGAGLGRHLQDKGRKVGYFKPIITDSEDAPPAGADGDAVFKKNSEHDCP